MANATRSAANCCRRIEVRKSINTGSREFAQTKVLLVHDAMFCLQELMNAENAVRIGIWNGVNRPGVTSRDASVTVYDPLGNFYADAGAASIIGCWVFPMLFSASTENDRVARHDLVVRHALGLQGSIHMLHEDGITSDHVLAPNCCDIDQRTTGDNRM